MLGFSTVIAPAWLTNDIWQGAAISAQHTIDAASEQIGMCFVPDEDMTITDAAMYFNITGSMTGVTAIFEFQTDYMSSNTVRYPSGTVVGGATSAFALPTSSGWCSLQTFGTAVSLTKGTPYWLVLRDGGGTAPTGSNYYSSVRTGGASSKSDGQAVRHHNGTNWTTTTLVYTSMFYYLKTSTGVWIGRPITQMNTSHGEVSAYGTVRAGAIQPPLCVPYRWHGVTIMTALAATNSPVDFEIEAWVNNQLVGVTPAHTPAHRESVIYFKTPVLVPAYAQAIAAVHSVDDGGNGTNYYRLFCHELIDDAAARPAMGVEDCAYAVSRASAAANVSWVHNNDLDVVYIFPIVEFLSEDLWSPPQLRTRPGRLDVRS